MKPSVKTEGFLYGRNSCSVWIYQRFVHFFPEKRTVCARFGKMHKIPRPTPEIFYKKFLRGGVALWQLLMYNKKNKMGECPKNVNNPY